ncbi:MAG: hypothetical protein JW913_16775 [Chitinispirillaceae bacterium]|nr:hypothetical protein [Chitinispirillaceae bacterium]
MKTTYHPGLVSIGNKIESASQIKDKQLKIRRLDALYEDLKRFKSVPGYGILQARIVEEYEKTGGIWPGFRDSVRTIRRAIEQAERTMNRQALLYWKMQLPKLALEFPKTRKTVTNLEKIVDTSLEMLPPAVKPSADVIAAVLKGDTMTRDDVITLQKYTQGCGTRNQNDEAKKLLDLNPKLSPRALCLIMNITDPSGVRRLNAWKNRKR